MTATAPRPRNVADIKSTLLNIALTSHYECFFNIPPEVTSFLTQSSIVGSQADLLTMSCCEATLPGSNLATRELNNDFTGVTNRHAYRRLYDDRADFTFYVNNEYRQIFLFERWLQFIAGEQIATAAQRNAFYRVKYPTQYKTDIFITKFERTAKNQTGRSTNTSSASSSSYTGSKLYYSFYNAFPISIASMPVSYESSSLLKCTVSFTYDRYIASNTSTQKSTLGSTTEPAGAQTATGVPNPFTPETQAAINAGFAGNLNLGNLSAGTLTNTNFNPTPTVQAPLPDPLVQGGTAVA
jgi:hypothetical protein